MAERAHPDDPGFKDNYKTHKLFGLIPIKQKIKNPYRDALFWRYSLVNNYCAGKNVLDVPCGVGWGTSQLTGCKSIVGIDISIDAIVDAKRMYGNAIDFRVGSMAHLDFPDNSIDLISCLEGIEHVPQEIGIKFINECYRVIKPSGRLIMSSPHCNDTHHSGNPYHIYEYQPYEIRSLVERYFSIEKELEKIVDNLTITVFFLKKR